MKKFFLIGLLATGCIGEDIISDQPDIQIMNSISELKVLQLHQFDYTFSVSFEIEPEEITWQSSDENVLVVNNFGTAAAGNSSGIATVSATAIYQNLIVTDEIDIEVSTYELNARITNPVSALDISTPYQLNFVFTNELSQQTSPDMAIWQSSDDDVLQVNNSGLMTGITEGSAAITLTCTYGTETITDTINVNVSNTTTTENQSRFGSLSSSSGNTLAGDFETSINQSNNLVIAFEDNFQADNSLDDLYIYLSNNPSSVASGLEVAKVEIYNGSNEYEVAGVNILDYNYVVFFNKSNQMIVGSGELMDAIAVLIRSGTIASTSSYDLQGSFTLEQDGNDLILSFESDYEADTGLPGLYVYLSNSSSSIGNALEIAAVTVFSGAHNYEISNAALDDYEFILYYCKPFNVKVGDGLITDGE